MPPTLHLDATRPQDMEHAAALLREGRTVAFPTETVYGLGANALSAQAVGSIFAAKQRPAWDPLIVHIPSVAELEGVAAVPPLLQSRVDKLAAAFWPGPLTLLLPRQERVPLAVTAGRPLVGVRVPGNATARELLRLAGVPVAAPSANRFGHTSPTTAQHVLDDLDGRIDAVLDGGPCVLGLESTVLDPQSMTIYRPGGVTAEMLETITGCQPVLYMPPERAEVEALPSPGVGIRHYAPRARVVLVPGSEAALNAALRSHRLESVGIMLPAGWHSGVQGDTVFEWGPWNAVATLAARLFAGLRELDDAGVAVIVCPMPEGEGLAQAIRDRLEKAARPA